MNMKKTIIAMVIPAVCGFATVVSASDIPSLGRTGNFDYDACGGIPFGEQETAVPKVGMGGTYMGMSASEFCGCVMMQVGEGVQQKMNCGVEL